MTTVIFTEEEMGLERVRHFQQLTRLARGVCSQAPEFAFLAHYYDAFVEGQCVCFLFPSVLSCSKITLNWS